jgi:hypothetical protein
MTGTYDTPTAVTFPAVDSAEPFAAFARVPSPRTYTVHDDPETIGERLRDEPADDWTVDRRQDRHDQMIYGDHR